MSMRMMVKTGWSDLQRMKDAYEDGEPNIYAQRDKDAVRSEIARKADDWLYFCAEKADFLGMQKDRAAFSPSLGIYRGFSAADNLSLNTCDALTYETVFGPVPDPVALLGRKYPERRFHVVVTCSVSDTSPENAMAEFFSAARDAGAMSADIYEEGVDGKTEFHKPEEIAPIAREAFGSPPEREGWRDGKISWDESRQSMFLVRMSYSTMGDGPEDALSVFFTALRYPGSMVAEVCDEDGKLVQEFYEEDVIRIYQAVYCEEPGNTPEGP